ncbi:T9SS type A sorting domain-containing protein [Lacibacter sp. H375]|uniref:sialidase family protein n=1 Tax=Lacibacter sp. H375 TaxID=3133424 RepID=UPI0030BE840D
MSKRFNIFSLCTWLVACFVICVWNYDLNKTAIAKTIMPPPGGKFEHEDSFRIMREKYWAALHTTAPGTNWKEIENKNREQIIKKQDERRSEVFRPSQIQSEVFANGKITGTWYERGSNNLSGRFTELVYDKEEDMLYGISAGRDFWKGKPDGSNWQVLNERVPLHGYGEILTLFKTATVKRFLTVSPTTNRPIYSSNNGSSWSGSAFNSAWSGYVDKLIMVDNSAQTIFMTAGYIFGPQYLFYSNDGGINFNKVNLTADFIAGQTYLSIAKAPAVNEVFLFDANKASYSVNETGVLTKRGNITGLPASTNVTTTTFTTRNYEFRISRDATSNLVFYALIDKRKLYKSADGLTWQAISNLPTESGCFKVFNVAPHNPNWLVYGEVDQFYSINGGVSWVRCNSWGEYYSNPNKFHADIMTFQYFQHANGEWFCISSNDGGVYRSIDNFATNTNIALSGLNISQYYDIGTDPVDPKYLWAGSQDQGYQYSSNTATTQTIPFTQVVSGDYTEIDFSPDTKDVLTQYVGGNLYYVRNARGAYSGTSFYQIPGADKGNYAWRIPVSAIKESPDNAFWVGGGNMNNAPGSFLIRVARNASNTTFTYTQLNYDFKANSRNGNSPLTSCEVSFVDTNYLFAATGDGSFFYSTNRGMNWNKTISFNGPTPPFLYPSSILVSKLDKNKVCFAGSGYSNPAFWRSTNHGQSFTSAITGLPATTIYDLAYNADETMIFAATEAGPYVFITEENKWHSLLGAYCPLSANYTCVEFVPALNTVRYGTYGRGIWDFKIESIITPVSNLSLSLSLIKVYPNPAGPVCYVKNDFNHAVQLSIIGINGSVLKTIPVPAKQNNMQVKLNEFAKGYYLFRFSYKNKLLATVPVEKNH